MKKLLVVLLAGAMLMTVSSMALAVPIYGDVDLFLGSSNLPNSNEQTEATFVNSILGTSFTSTDIIQITGTSWTLVDQSHGAFALSSAPQWFLVKAGNTHYLYENNTDLDWAYVDFAASGMATNPQGVFIANGISHFSELEGSTPVPEPGTMMLLGFGMLGLAVYGKRRMNKEA